jgi:hypothetical protein
MTSSDLDKDQIRDVMQGYARGVNRREWDLLLAAVFVTGHYRHEHRRAQLLRHQSSFGLYWHRQMHWRRTGTPGTTRNPGMRIHPLPSQWSVPSAIQRAPGVDNL